MSSRTRSFLSMPTNDRILPQCAGAHFSCASVGRWTSRSPGRRSGPLSSSPTGNWLFSELVATRSRLVEVRMGTAAAGTQGRTTPSRSRRSAARTPQTGRTMPSPGRTYPHPACGRQSAYPLDQGGLIRTLPVSRSPLELPTAGSQGRLAPSPTRADLSEPCLCRGRQPTPDARPPPAARATLRP